MGSISAIAGHSNPQFTRHVKARYSALEQLLTAAEAAQELAAHPGWAHVTALLDDELVDIDRTLDSGRPLESRAHYAAMHGRRGGLKGAEEALQALVSLAETRLAEQRAKHEGDAEPSSGGNA